MVGLRGLVVDDRDGARRACAKRVLRGGVCDTGSRGYPRRPSKNTHPFRDPTRRREPFKAYRCRKISERDRVAGTGAIVAATAVLYAAASSCAPTIPIGALRFCPQGPTEPDGGAGIDPDASVTLPWTTGFEDGFCDYAAPMGFCKLTGSGSYTVVTSPVHSGHYAAEFTVQSLPDGGASQSRCVEQGVFPETAYYGAWYYVPAPAQNSGVWNLFHFQAGPAGGTLDGLWDVSLVNVGDGGPLHTVFFDFLSNGAPDASAVPNIPIGKWFHLEVYFKRASDATGELSFLQDGVPAVTLTGLATEKTGDTGWGQLFIGNYANALVPPSSTVYVDDVTFGSAP
jgi:hypothetical protein